MRGIKEVILVLALGVSTSAQAQYIGASRPPSRQEMLDSLAARTDTSRFAADSLRLDSLAAASAAGDGALESKAAGDSTYLHTRIDSVRDNAGGNVIRPVGLMQPDSLAVLAHRNVKQISTLAEYATIGAGAWGGALSTGYSGQYFNGFATDTLALWGAYSNNGGGRDTLTSTLDLAQYPNGDATGGAGVIRCVIWMKQAWIDALSDGVYIAFGVGGRNGIFYYIIPKASLSSGFNVVTLPQSSFYQYGSPNWSSIRNVLFGIWGATVGSVIDTVVVDDFHLIRPHGAVPDPFVTASGVAWGVSSNSGLSIYHDSLMAVLDGDSLISVDAAPDTTNGTLRLGQLDSTFLAIRGSGKIRLTVRGGSMLKLETDAVRDSVPITLAVGDLVPWQVVVDGTNVYATAKDSVLSGTWSGGADSSIVKMRLLDRLDELPETTPDYSGNMYQIDLGGGVKIYATGDSTSTN